MRTARRRARRTRRARASPAHDGAAHDHAERRVRDVERFRAIPGRGVRAELDGRLCFAGRPDLLGAHAEDPALVAAVERLERRARRPSWSATRTAPSA